MMELRVHLKKRMESITTKKLPANKLKLKIKTRKKLENMTLLNKFMEDSSICSRVRRASIVSNLLLQNDINWNIKER